MRVFMVMKVILTVVHTKKSTIAIMKITNMIMKTLKLKKSIIANTKKQNMMNMNTIMKKVTMTRMMTPIIMRKTSKKMKA